jgi:hypothetical protein
MMSQEEMITLSIVYTDTDGEQHILVPGSREAPYLQLPK